MKAINRGDGTYDIFDDSLRVFDQLPVQSYVVRFAQFHGFYLEKYVGMDISEPKVYGIHDAKVQKVLDSFKSMPRSLGVILSGDKGIGKSLFAKMLAGRAIQNGIPVIVVDKYTDGIASYIESIEQEVMVLFDEFDKTFGEIRSEDGKASPQTGLLTLFDGISGGKKLFVVTCNDLYRLNEYLVNRPGRFHYHFRFDYPSAQEIRQYLTDKLAPQYVGEIDNVVSFAAKVSLNYDCLRAIAFELNNGYSFSDAIQDLNIVNTQNERYRLMMRFKNGVVLTNKDVSMDMFSGEDSYAYIFDNKGDAIVNVTFNAMNAVFDNRTGNYVILPENLHIEYLTDSGEDNSELAKALKDVGPEYLAIERRERRGIHYAA